MYARRTSVAHREEHLGVLAVALAAERPGHGEPQRQADVVVGLDFAVASLAARSGMGSVLSPIIHTRRLPSIYVAHLAFLQSHQRSFTQPRRIEQCGAKGDARNVERKHLENAGGSRDGRRRRAQRRWGMKRGRKWPIAFSFKHCISHRT